MLKLPDVTLVCVETREHELARMAISDCLRVAEFGDVLILTDKPGKFTQTYNPTVFGFKPDFITVFGTKCRFHQVEDWPDKLGWSRSWWYDVPPLLRTRQTLNIQWDSWIWDASKWTDEFLDYDYIGAPWWHTDGKNVGNGGFSLVSTRLKRFLLKHRDKFPCDTDVDDDLLCRKYRRTLEEFGFRWAPEKVARQFAWEGCNQPKTETTHFGFHAMFNWGLVLDRERLLERARVAFQSKHLTRPGNYQLRAFCEANPDIARQLIVEQEPHLKITGD